MYLFWRLEKVRLRSKLPVVTIAWAAMILMTRSSTGWCREFKNENGFDLKNDKMAMHRLKEAAEKAKHELSSLMSVDINIPYITATQDGPLHMERTLTRARFDDMTAELVEKTVGPMKQAMKDANLKPAELDKIILVGGSTRIPAVQEAVKNFTGKEPFKGINPDEVVGLGAAIQAGVLNR